MARLLSVNVGLPRDILWNGKTVHTSIWKAPVEGRRTVRRLDIDGDVRTMRKGDVAVVPSWVRHGAWTADTTCLEVDVFSPPRQSLLRLAEANAKDAAPPAPADAD